MGRMSLSAKVATLAAHPAQEREADVGRILGVAQRSEQSDEGIAAAPLLL
jgi:hypothetical protein